MAAEDLIRADEEVEVEDAGDDSYCEIEEVYSKFENTTTSAN